MVARQREDADGGEASAAFRHVSVPHVDKEKFQSNLLITSKYSAFNFLPIALGEQFQRAANVYFVIVITLMALGTFASRHLFDSVFDPWSTMGPFLMILSISMARQAIADLARHRDDRIINNRPCVRVELPRPRRRLSATLSLGSSTNLDSDGGAENGESGAPKEPERATQIRWQEIHVGDVLLVHGREELPADVLVIATSQANGVCHVETSNIDGETNLKLRQAPALTQSVLCEDYGEEGAESMADAHDSEGQPRSAADRKDGDEGRGAGAEEEEEEEEEEVEFVPPSVNVVARRAARTMRGSMQYQQPSDNMHEMSGVLRLEGQADPIVMSPRMLLLRGSVLRNCSWVVAIVLYTGKDTRVAKKVQSSGRKMSRMERLMNRAVRLIFVCYVATVSISTICAAVLATDNAEIGYVSPFGESSPPSRVLPDWLANWLGYFVLYSNFVPIALYVTVELVYALQTMLIEADAKMYDKETDTPCRARTANLNTELGQVQYVFSDKTGTLTQNKMEFRAAAVGGVLAWNGQKMEGQETPVPAVHGARLQALWKEQPPSLYALATEAHATLRHARDSAAGPDAGRPRPRSLTVAQAERVEQFLRCLAMCNTLLTVQRGRRPSVVAMPRGASEDDAEAPWIAESPDELALASAASDAGMQLVQRGHKTALLMWRGRVEQWRILHVNEFSSERKCMSILLRSRSGQALVLVKGADSVMMPGAARNEEEEGGEEEGEEKGFPSDEGSKAQKEMNDHLRFFGTRGLRTLVLGAREVDSEQAEAWVELRRAADNDPERRQELLTQLAGEMERDYKLLGCTGIEDKLQENVPSTIFALRRAGINVWVLTGDKMETAVNIGQSSRLIGRDMTLVRMAAADARKAAKPRPGGDAEAKVKDSETRDAASATSASPPDGEGGADEQGEAAAAPPPVRAGEGVESTDAGAAGAEGNLERALSGMRGDSSERKRLVAHVEAKLAELERLTAAEHSRRTSEVEAASEAAARAALAPKEGAGVAGGGEGAPAHGDAAILSPTQAAARARGRVLSRIGVAMAIDGPCMAVLFGEERLARRFAAIMGGLSAVIACRASPQQKRHLVGWVKRNVSPEPLTLAIGDGANDVGMINEADVGIGIAGKEGLQAANASDFAIARFSHLRRLLLVHGRWSYVRMSHVLLYSIWKNALLSLVTFLFAFWNNLSGTSPFETLAYTGFNVFTSAPIVALGALDQDVPERVCLEVPEVYETGRCNLEMNLRSMVGWTLSSAVYAALLFVPWLLTYNCATTNHADGTMDGLDVIGTSLYACIVIAVHGRCITLSNSWTWVNVLVHVLSLLVFFAFLFARSLDPIFSSHFLWTALRLFDTGTFWFLLLFTAAVCALFDTIVVAVRHAFAPTHLDLLKLSMAEFKEQTRRRSSVLDVSSPDTAEQAQQSQSGEGQPTPKLAEVKEEEEEEEEEEGEDIGRAESAEQAEGSGQEPGVELAGRPQSGGGSEKSATE